MISLPHLWNVPDFSEKSRAGRNFFGIELYSYITKYNGFKLELRYDIVCIETGQLCAVATSSHCFTDTKIKPMRIRDKFPEMHAFFQKAMEVTYPEH